MALQVVPEGLAAASAGVEALTARLAAAHAGAAPLITAVVPPAADPVSLQTAAGFSAQGSEHAAVEALTARLAAAHAGAAPLITGVVPPAADPVSLQTAAGFSAQGTEHAAVAAQGVEELGRSGVGVAESGVNYATGDAAAASTYLVARG